MAKPIKFIPPQVDPLAGTTTEAARKNPLRLLLQDLGVLIKMLRYLPWTMMPFRTSDKGAELYISPKTMLDVILNTWLILFQSILLLVAIPAFIILPGGIFLLSAALCIVVILVTAWPMQGQRIAYSIMDERTATIAKQHGSERWIFVNGIMTGRSGLQNNIDRLSQTFGRACVGVHNNSYGLVSDLLECLIQRCFSYSTLDTRIAYDYVKACATDPTVTKIVLIGHSQGGIVVSNLLDQLFADVPQSSVSKLEVYTFGSAASHFSNPRISLAAASPQGIIPHIEHYCNEYDMVPRWGVLRNTTEVLNNRYSGTIFVRMDASGHMFNQHYMDVMFPAALGLASVPNHTRPEAVPDPIQALLDEFLDKVVDVDEKLARKRENIAIQNMGLMRRESGIEFGDGQALPVGIIVNGDGGVPHDGADAGIGFINAGDHAILGLGREAQGKTVRELSRLWMYLGGRSPAV